MDIKSLLTSKFGGVGELAKVCGITHGAVSQWEKIPLYHIPVILAAAKERGIADITLALFYPDETSESKQNHSSPPKNINKT